MGRDSDITSFNGNNYPAWRTDVRSEMVGKEVWYTCTKDNSIVLRIVDKTASRAKYEEVKSEYDSRKAVYDEMLAKSKGKTGDTEETLKAPIPPDPKDHILFADKVFNITVFDDEDDSDPQKVKDFRRDMCKAYSILMKSLKPQFKIPVQNFDTAKQIWDYMEATYNKKTAVSKVMMFEDFFGKQMKEGEPLKNHLAWFDQKTAELATSGITIPEEVMAIRLLLSLPPEFVHMRAALESTHMDTPFSIADVKTAALQDEARRKGQNAAYSEGALRTQYQQQGGQFDKFKKHKKRWCEHCKTNTHDTNKCFHLHPDLDPKPWKRKDYKKDQDSKKDDKKDGRKDRSDRKEKASHATFTEETARIVREVRPSLDQWVLDSGASSHMTRHREHILNYEEFDVPCTVSEADGRVMPAFGRGDVKMHMHISDGDRDIVWHDVLFVPDLKDNLFSVSTARAGGLVIGEKHGEVVLFDNKGRVVVSTKQIGKDIIVTCEELVDERTYSVKSKPDSQVWHRRMAHMGKDRLIQTAKIVDGISLPSKFEDCVCDSCIQGKQHRAALSTKTIPHADQPGKRMFSDLWGPARVQTQGGKRFFSHHIDHHSLWDDIAFLREKSDELEEFKAVCKSFKSRFGYDVLTLRTDNGGEYDSAEFKKFCKANGIVQEWTAPDTPSQNGIAERRNRTYLNMARAIMIESGVPDSFWAEAIYFVNYICNRSATKSLDKSPYEILYHKKPDLSHIRVFGCNAWVLDRNPDGKLAPRSMLCVYLGPTDNIGNHRLYNPATRKFISSRDVIFDEHNFYFKPSSENQPLELEPEDIKEEDDEEMEELVDTDDESEDPEEEVDVKPTSSFPSFPTIDAGLEEESTPPAQSAKYPPTPQEPVKRKRRNELEMLKALPKHTERLEKAKIAIVGEPKTFKQAMNGPDAAKWDAAAKKELKALHDMSTWDLVPLPLGREVVGCKWVWKVKTNADGSVERYKARLVAQGFSQSPGVDFDETWSPTARWNSIRTLLALAASEKLDVYQLDIDSAYLYGELDEEIYMKQPEGFVDAKHPDWVLRLKRALYGLKQSGRVWNSEIHRYLLGLGFVQNPADPCIYSIIHKDGTKSYLGLYVDDIIICCCGRDYMNWIVMKLEKKYGVKDLGLAKWILGVAIEQKPGRIVLSQTTYTKSILEEFGMLECHPLSTPTCGGDLGLSSPDVMIGQSGFEDPTLYRSAVCALYGRFTHSLCASRIGCALR